MEIDIFLHLQTFHSRKTSLHCSFCGESLLASDLCSQAQLLLGRKKRRQCMDKTAVRCSRSGCDEAYCSETCRDLHSLRNGHHLYCSGSSKQSRDFYRFCSSNNLDRLLFAAVLLSRYIRWQFTIDICHLALDIDI